MEQPTLTQLLESLLFVSSKPVTAGHLATFLSTDEGAVRRALGELAEQRKGSGVVLLESNGSYQLATSAQTSQQVKAYLNQELREKLTDATLEVLTIIAYRQPISKSEIEAIRGVNSQYSLRHLLMRGLVEKVQNPDDARSFLYQTTTEFLQHLGLTSVSDLPDFQSLTEAVRLPQAQAVTDAAEEQNPDPGAAPPAPEN